MKRTADERAAIPGSEVSYFKASRAASSPTLADIVDRLLNSELDNIQSAIASGSDERVAQVIRSLDQRGVAADLIRQQYAGRYPFELLQNANDAAAKARDEGAPRKQMAVRFVLTDTALVVANMGAAFGEEEVTAICGLGRSSKDPRKSIGYKGIGFKSVGEISEKPQIFSRGRAFGFDEERARSAIEGLLGETMRPRRIPAFAFPFPIDLDQVNEDRALILECLEQGYVTVLRLPFKSDVTRGDVSKVLSETLSPRILLFLDAVDALIVDGIEAPYRAERLDEKRQGAKHIVLGVKRLGEPDLEDWLLIEDSIEIRDRTLVASLGEKWKEVSHVRCAAVIRLRSDGMPHIGGTYPLHVYLPTEDSCGLPFMVHADFVLELSRRSIGNAPEVKPYNDWLSGQLAQFIVGRVAPALFEQFREDPSVIGILALDEETPGFGKRMREKYLAALRASPFIPTMDGRRVTAGEARLLPYDLANEHQAASFLRLVEVAGLVLPEIQAESRARELLRDQLRVKALEPRQTLALLREDIQDIDAFYRWLLAWAERHGFLSLAGMLTDVPCVYTSKGKWVKPGKNVFYPRERDAPSVPGDLPIWIAAVPDAARDLLSKAGVNPFRWREILLGFVLPSLSSPATGDSVRTNAHESLRAYFESEGGEDKDIASRLTEVLVPATRAEGGSPVLRRTAEVYFPTPRLKQIYGPFGRHEFLDWPWPSSEGERAALERYLKWLGVTASPRLDSREVDVRHPSSALWQKWQVEIADAINCPLVHSGSNRNAAPHALDRFEELVAAADTARLESLFAEIAEAWHNWHTKLETQVRCSHSAHPKSAPGKTVLSLFFFGLKELPWVPAARGQAKGLFKPSEVWRPGNDVPRKIVARLPVLSPALEHAGGYLLGTPLGMVDSARASAEQVMGMLHLLARDAERQADAMTDDAILAARWAMRRLNDALEDASPLGAGEASPLLVVRGGRHFFATNPFVADDPMLAELWKDEIPILAADRELRRLQRAFRLRDLRHHARIVPRPIHPKQAASDTLQRQLHDASPYLAALVLDAAPSQIEAMRGRIKRVKMLACEKLLLECSLEGARSFEHPATVYLAQSKESAAGPIERSGATIHVQMLDGDPADWYSIGRQLAGFLLVPAQADAFALILEGDERKRNAYLRSRRIALQTVLEERAKLGAVSDEALQLTESVVEPYRSPEQPAAPSQSSSPGASGSDAAPPASTSQPSQSKDAPQTKAPPLDPTGIMAYDVVDGTAPQPRSKDLMQPRSPSQGERDWDGEAATNRDNGKRGEEAVYLYERDRVKAAGGDPELVVWQSKKDPEGPYDIKSIDELGQVLYIEVKSTSSSEDDLEFDISEGQLLFALANEDAHAIYRVVDVNAASPRIYRYRNTARFLRMQQASLRLSGAKMRLPKHEATG
ncbi:sacsin N-terminal ATP-binding-like domain-containing protein [Polyangium aurulentum]|uniref:sacsin N-terminal ATP-binding-like domain-containing protein n=1 Tax=Polyangium aurulentum TaxID=2567896 RepID=UPI0010AEA3F6|nr:DUF3883 domain-containing protein [Polyangium aurulentum]UQA61387.1 DUF3883 domain-containing protein [Polyangium aurulentum]